MYLEYAETAFYVIYPDFSNVDMRLIIDITSGSADAFLATDDIFIVAKNGAGTNTVLFNQDKFGPNASILKVLQENINTETSLNWRWLLSIQYCTTSNFFTFFFSYPPVLWLRNITNRVTIVSPFTEFDFQKTQFYLVIQSKSAKTMGNVIFVQDQPRFELFVFLTVFCSCFVLFISAFVLFWHLKLTRGQRRVRNDHSMEIELLSNRPLARFSLLFDEDINENEDESLSKCHCRPCCLQYLRNGQSSVGTVVVRLPGGRRAPVQLCLASALMSEQDNEIKNEFDAVSVNSRREAKPANSIFSRISRNRIQPLGMTRQDP